MSTLAGAAMLVASGRKVSFASGIGHGLWTFFRAYILRCGFLDGREGFLLAVIGGVAVSLLLLPSPLAGFRIPASET